MQITKILILLFSLFVLSYTAYAASTADPSEDIEETEIAGEDEKESDATEESTTTAKPTLTIRMPPALSHEAGSKFPDKPLQHKDTYYSGTYKVWPKSVGNEAFELGEVTTQCYENRMEVLIRFASAFNGYIYPYHRFRACPLVPVDGLKAINLQINNDSCGLDIAYGTDDGILSFYEYTLMVQWDKEVLGKYDRKLQLTCIRENVDHRVVHMQAPDELEDKPVEVTMEIESQTEDEHDVTDQQSYDVARVGETVDVTFALTNAEYDIRVISCTVHDGLRDQNEVVTTYNGDQSSSQAYDGRKRLYTKGCPEDAKYLPAFTKDKKASRITLTSSLKIFRFPSSNFLLFQCNLQICHDQCPERKCNTEAEPDFSEPQSKTVKLFRPIMVKVGGYMGTDHAFHSSSPLARGMPAASFIAGLIGMGFICAIVCVFMYRRFKKGTEKNYKMKYSANNDKTTEEVAPLKVTAAATD